MSNAPAGPRSPRARGPRGTSKRVRAPSEFVVDSTTQVLLRMEGIARLVGLVSLLVALPLLWMGWVLAANLAGC